MQHWSLMCFRIQFNIRAHCCIIATLKEKNKIRLHENWKIYHISYANSCSAGIIILKCLKQEHREISDVHVCRANWITFCGKIRSIHSDEMQPRMMSNGTMSESDTPCNAIGAGFRLLLLHGMLDIWRALSRSSHHQTKEKGPVSDGSSAIALRHSHFASSNTMNSRSTNRGSK